MKHIFHPILGDSKHGDLHQNRAFTAYFGIKRLMLHASSLNIIHPLNHSPITIKAELDHNWQSILENFN